jgi:hypothetical protein
MSKIFAAAIILTLCFVTLAPLAGIAHAATIRIDPNGAP